MNELALFAGTGGGVLAGHILGWRTICAVERDAYAAQVLAQRQNDGVLPPFPIWSDVRSFDGRRWRGLVDVISGGFPCQDISSAGPGTGIEGSRSGLWKDMARIISEVLPGEVLLENSPMLVGRGLAMVVGDLTQMGYDSEWCLVSAADLGAPHRRDRIWLLGWRNDRHSPILANPSREHVQRLVAQRTPTQIGRQPLEGSVGPCGDGPSRWPIEPDMGRVADGVAFRVDRLKALGNGQVPRVAAAALHGLESGQW
ncbi:DNA cytosine methyltransferase [Pseudomonas sp. ITEM 17296]|uniref:DNA cytosine methyltransferase n=1 Tax=Pseudomonas sp. ITEM 17296 TaxID=2790281 RepID=UPI00237FDFFE|nr:DNA cytosine methyltransferase [Pseudomonas sp. ITEM 17296]MDE4537700.1 DNA cytosine methyltransferase [Pseudomonas sp. ITEM 17296]